jgi:hypothetical protein
MILLEVETHRVAIFELESDAPRTIDVDRVSGRTMAMQDMKIEAWNVHVLRPPGPIESVQTPEGSSMHPGVDLPR